MKNKIYIIDGRSLGDTDIPDLFTDDEFKQYFKNNGGGSMSLETFVDTWNNYPECLPSPDYTYIRIINN